MALFAGDIFIGLVGHNISVTLSMTESEDISLTEVARYVFFLHQVLDYLELGREACAISSRTTMGG